ncbi:unnamed protein product [Zymoseptoria tritici ST99CH_1E4]|uniref:Uncharacterized protein n=1 Tax=Zymoseptoria tritici ST99CH_1E4 TaxID=1276532 RepID=A0A2H1H9F5_ZYMTR|nr:unnamed protein product [Zymoseptoria tritici ST99CH_1E4]
MSDDEGSISDEDDMYISEDYFGMRIDGGRPATGLAKEAKTLLGKNSTSVPAKEQKRKVVPKSITGLDNTSPTTTNLSGENTNLSGRYRNTDDTLIEVQRSELPAEIVQQTIYESRCIGEVGLKPACQRCTKPVDGPYDEAPRLVITAPLREPREEQAQPSEASS